MHEASAGKLELWGGIEYTVHRLGDAFFDQMERSGHAARSDDLDRLAGLGLRALRYPVLWERTAPERLDQPDWSWPDARLARLRALGVRPIVGLLHHGSGPAYTSLVDPAFPDLLARYAGMVAARYPWVTDYTPVNEPLTTARFSGLYGLWYPHGEDDATFARAIVNQCRATALAMQAIRSVTPGARLIQTEDLGRAFGTPALAREAEFQNTRRWLTFDLLCGRVTREHPLWAYLTGAGVAPDALRWFTEYPCPPDIVGLNSYITSERFLDERMDQYPEYARVQHGTRDYADVAAVHVRVAGRVGHHALLHEAWARYGLPLAITEAHTAGPREEQLRWLAEIWHDATRLRADGVDLRALTIWSLLGAFDWNSLLTRQDGFYEPGAFDVRAPEPRPTAVAAMARSLARGSLPDHAVLDGPGWWRRAARHSFACLDEDGAARVDLPLLPYMRQAPRPLLISGATGTLGRAFARICEQRGLAHRLLDRAALDIADPASVAAALDATRPWAVINAAGYVRVDDAEHEAARCLRENADGPAALAAACAARGIALLTFSSDLVFDGGQARPYVERDPVAPLNVYGRSKAEAERRVLAALPLALVVRTSAFFGPWDRYNFVWAALRAVAGGDEFVAADDGAVAATYVPDLVDTCLDLLIDGESGLWHLANQGGVNWADLARRAVGRAGHDAGRVRGVPTATLGLAARRPANSVLGSERGALLPTLDDALDRYLRAYASDTPSS